MQWIVDNVEWLFGGIGVAVVTGIFALFKNSKGNTINSGDHSKNYQSEKDININSNEGDSNEK